VIEDDSALVAKLFDEGYKARPERAIWDARA